MDRLFSDIEKDAATKLTSEEAIEDYFVGKISAAQNEGFTLTPEMLTKMEDLKTSLIEVVPFSGEEGNEAGAVVYKTCSVCDIPRACNEIMEYEGELYCNKHKPKSSCSIV